jgi:hypothetical protein
VIWRALLLTAVALAERTVPERWKSTTRAELIGELARSAGIDEPVPLEATIALQADIAGEIFGGEPGSDAWRQRRDDEVAALTSGLEQPLAAPDLGASLAELERRTEQLEAEQRERERLASKLAAIERSKSWRLTAPLRAARRR